MALAIEQRASAEPFRKEGNPRRRSRSPAREFWRRFLHNPRIWFGLSIALILIGASFLAPWVAPTDPEDMDIALRLAPPSAADWLGRDLNGGSVLTAMLYGGRTSLYISFITVLLSITVGAGIGLIAGYKRGVVDAILMRTVDLLMAFPGILLAMALAAFMGPSLNNVIFAIAATGWTSSARLVRGQTLSVREREYVAATKALGAGDLRIIVKHIFPATLSPLVVQATFSLSGVIVTESSLSFLGLGAEDGAPSWGSMLSQGRTVLTEAPWLSIFPGLAIMLMVISLNFIGDALRDILDPKTVQK